MQPHILKAIQKAREEFEKMYDGICTITQKGKSVDPITHKTTYRDSVVYENEPCRLSEKSVAATSQGIVAGVTKEMVLFIAPELDIKPGSKITITQNGKTEDYERSGEPITHKTHQEIVLSLWKDKA